MMRAAAAAAAAALAATVRAEPNHTLSYLPFSWDTLPRYTFCVNSTGPFSADVVDYVAKQDIMIHNPVLDRQPGAVTALDDRAPAQAAALRAVNPKIQNWFYYGMDKLREHDYASDAIVYFRPECLLKDVNGTVVPKLVWDFGTECGREAWLNTSRTMITKGGLDGIFLDGFQGCDPFGTPGCQRVCDDTICDPDVMTAWNEGLVEAMWTLKNDILGPNGTFTCNYTPGPFVCDNTKPVSECPCDATNDERGGGNWDHMRYIADLEATQDDYAMLTHTPHGDVDDSLLKSVALFLLATSEYQYHGSGFGYECGADGWLYRSDEVEHAYAAPLGAPLADAAESPGCATQETYCVRTRNFAAGTKVYVNETAPAICIVWADGINTTQNGGCDEARDWPF